MWRAACRVAFLVTGQRDAVLSSCALSNGTAAKVDSSDLLRGPCRGRPLRAALGRILVDISRRRIGYRDTAIARGHKSILAPADWSCNGEFFAARCVDPRQNYGKSRFGLIVDRRRNDFRICRRLRRCNQASPSKSKHVATNRRIVFFNLPRPPAHHGGSQGNIRWPCNPGHCLADLNPFDFPVRTALGTMDHEPGSRLWATPLRMDLRPESLGAATGENRRMKCIDRGAGLQH